MHQEFFPVRLAVLSGLGFLCALAAHGTEPTRSSVSPPGPNPYLSFLPVGVEPDYDAWRGFMELGAAARFDRLDSGLGKALDVQETEPNNSLGEANPIAGFGNGPGEDPVADVTGIFAAPAAPSPLGPYAEDDGSIPLATEIPLAAGQAVIVQGTIGDGPFGSGGTGSGDLDFFKISGVLEGQAIIIDIETPEPLGDLDTFIGLYDGDGNSIALNEDEDSATNHDGYLAIPAPYDSDYYVSVAGSLFPFASVLSDPYDSSTGFGVGSEGDYSLILRLENGDPDWFEIELDVCDVLGASLEGSGVQLQLIDPDGTTLRIGSSQDLSFSYSDASPLPGAGRAVFAHVATTAGTYAIRVLGHEGTAYTLKLRAFRQPLETTVEPQRIFVDFDGAVVDPGIFGFPPGEEDLSPLSSFMAGWGLGPGDLDGVIDATLATLSENVLNDPRFQGPNRDVYVEILNSRDHADPGADPSVSRLIIGGSIGELGIPTIGIAQSIDVGNFDAGEIAVVLLDLLSGSELDPNSLNSFPRAEGSSMVEFVGRSLGNIAAHEAGHYLGSYHTEQDNPLAGLMDRGGNLPNTLGLGTDGIYGTEDDVDVDFEQDMFVPAERFAGFENTLTVVSCGLAGATAIFNDGFETGDLRHWTSEAAR